ncbi:MAG: transporter, partial [Caulobacter sp.]
DEQLRELNRLREERDDALALMRAGAIGMTAAIATAPRDEASAAAQTPAPSPMRVSPSPADARAGSAGEADAPPAPQSVIVAAIPEGFGVLTPRGDLVLDPTFEFTRSSANRLVFRGVEIVPGIQLGVIEANDADRDSLVASLGARYGLGERLEVEARAPYVYRHDRVTTVVQRDETISRTMDIEGQDLGDIEFAARYQLNRGTGGWPVFVGQLRIKTPSGRGPFEVIYDEFGVAEDLATGSGFWSVEPGVTVLYASDPAVLFGGVSYLHSFARDIDKLLGGVPVGRVEPGDSIGLSMGFAFALNPRFSYSLGYAHNYIFATKTELGDTVQRSNSLQAGRLTMGLSLRLTETITVSNNFEFGVTSDAPDMRWSLRVPIRF